MSALDINEYVTDTADQRGRVNIGIKNASSTVTYVVLDPDSMDRLDGPTTQDSQSDGRLSIGSEFEGEEVTVGLLNVE